MKTASRSRYSLVPWQCNSGASDQYLTKRDSIYHTTQMSSSNSRTDAKDSLAKPPGPFIMTRCKSGKQEFSPTDPASKKKR